jgi:hypothetical protein
MIHQLNSIFSYKHPNLDAFWQRISFSTKDTRDQQRFVSEYRSSMLYSYSLIAGDDLRANESQSP